MEIEKIKMQSTAVLVDSRSSGYNLSGKQILKTNANNARRFS